MPLKLFHYNWITENCIRRHITLVLKCCNKFRVIILLMHKWQSAVCERTSRSHISAWVGFCNQTLSFTARMPSSISILPHTQAESAAHVCLLMAQVFSCCSRLFFFFFLLTRACTFYPPQHTGDSPARMHFCGWNAFWEDNRIALTYMISPAAFANRCTRVRLERRALQCANSQRTWRLTLRRFTLTQSCFALKGMERQKMNRERVIS
jgi:hypothetical protein